MRKLFVNGLQGAKEFAGWDNAEVKVAYAEFLTKFKKEDNATARHLFIANGAEDFNRVSIRNCLELWMCTYSDSMIPEFRDSECCGFGIFSKNEGQCFLREDEIKWDESEENGELTLHIWSNNTNEPSDIKVKINKNSTLVDLYPATGNEDYILTTNDVEYRFETL